MSQIQTTLILIKYTQSDTIEKTVDKIVFYIKNKFAIDDDLKKNFEFFDFKVGNNIDTFIKYLLALE